MVSKWVRARELEKPRRTHEVTLIRCVRERVCYFRVFAYHPQAFPPSLELVNSGHLIKIEPRYHDLWMFPDHSCNEVKWFAWLFWEESCVRLISIKVAFFTLFNQVWIHDPALDATSKLLWVKDCLFLLHFVLSKHWVLWRIYYYLFKGIAAVIYFIIIIHQI